MELPHTFLRASIVDNSKPFTEEEGRKLLDRFWGEVSEKTLESILARKGTNTYTPSEIQPAGV